jgi:pSer/pThr/pTyr-binding forkhead associated (FHA) protein
MAVTLLIRHKGQQWRYTLHTSVIDIGRGSDNDITLIDDKVSRRHARLQQSGAEWRIEDLQSANGVTLNGVAIVSATLTAKDIVQIGDATLHLLNVADAEMSKTVVAQAQLSETQLATPMFDETLRDLPDEGDALEVILPDTNKARLAIQLEGRTWEIVLPTTKVTIGRSPDCTLVLNHPKVSRQHAYIEWQAGAALLVDNDSANGTFVNGAKIERYLLTGGESVRLGAAVLVYKPAFTTDQLLQPISSTPFQKSASSPPKRKPIVFIPGFMGSQLWQGETLVWPDLKKLVANPELFKLPEREALRVAGLVEDVVVVPGLYKLEQYSQLTEFLRESLGYESGKDLYEFAYDWRRDLRETAQQLKNQIDQWRATLPDPSTKVTIIAHSMGSLVTRYYVDMLGGDRAAERLILMGGPQQGSPKIVVGLLTGTGLLPFGLFSDKIRDVLATFPSAYQLIPNFPIIFDAEDRPIDHFADDRWVQEPYRHYLHNAKEFRSQLNPSARVPTLCIVGYGNKTVIKTKVHVHENGLWSETQLVEDEEGDNNVPVHSGILDGADIHPVQQSHGALYADNDVKYRLRLELLK